MIELFGWLYVLVFLSLLAVFTYRTSQKLLNPKRRLFTGPYCALVLSLLVCLLINIVFPTQFDTMVNKVVPQAYPIPAPDAAAVALHKQLFIADMHSDSLMWARRNLLEQNSYGHVDLPRLVQGNVALQFFTIVTGSPVGLNFNTNEAPSLLTDSITLKAVVEGWSLGSVTSRAERTLFQAHSLHTYAEKSGGQLVIIKTKSDLANLKAAREEHRHVVGSLLGIEGLHALDDKFTNVEAFFNAGIRMMAPTHFFDNAVGGSAHGVVKTGLTNFGVKVIKEMERLGIAVDLAHASEATIDDILKIATRPIVVSHTGVRGVCESPRNLRDDHVQVLMGPGIAATGGVIGIAYFRPAICGGPDMEPGDDLGSIIKSIAYVRDLVGIRHVALGSDFDGTVATPFDTTGLVHITDALLRNGFSPADVSLVMGGNVLRVFQQLLPE